MVANLESKKRISGDALLYAVGRQGNIDELNLDAAKIRRPSSRVDSSLVMIVAVIPSTGVMWSEPSRRGKS